MGTTNLGSFSMNEASSRLASCLPRLEIQSATPAEPSQFQGTKQRTPAKHASSTFSCLSFGAHHGESHRSVSCRLTDIALVTRILLTSWLGGLLPPVVLALALASIWETFACASRGREGRGQCMSGFALHLHSEDFWCSKSGWMGDTCHVS